MYELPWDRAGISEKKQIRIARYNHILTYPPILSLFLEILPFFSEFQQTMSWDINFEKKRP